METATTIALSMFSSLTALTIARFTTLKLEINEWHEHDIQLKSRLSIYHHYLAKSSHPDDICKLGNLINKEIVNFLLENPEVFENNEIKTSKKESSFVKHQSKTITQLKTLIKEAKRKAFAANGNETDRKSFWNICKAISDLKRKEDEDQKNKT